ncbi:hypothetical protein K438DRAFT_789967 [Mycena galopus ATCC 62051]|nr:hypothetical protein K438DRAFT_789967 [Mycena galopus ATCC 62051]
MPSEWLDTLNAAVAAGSIPKVPVSTQSHNENPAYPGSRGVQSCTPFFIWCSYGLIQMASLCARRHGSAKIRMMSGMLRPTKSALVLTMGHNQ